MNSLLKIVVLLLLPIALVFDFAVMVVALILRMLVVVPALIILAIIGIFTANK